MPRFFGFSRGRRGDSAQRFRGASQKLASAQDRASGVGDERIVHVFNSSQVSGPENLVLPALADSGLRACVLFLREARRGEAGRRPADHATSLGLPVIEVEVGGRVDLLAVAETARALARVRPAVAHAHDVKASTYLLGAVRLLGARAPALVSTHHGIHGRPDTRSRLYESFYVRGVLPNFARVLAVSSADRDELLRRGLRAERVFLHLNGVDARRVEAAERVAERRRLRAAWGVPDEAGPIVGVVARLSAEKRHDRVLEVAAELVRLDPARPFCVLCFGQGPLEEALRRRVHALGLQGRVELCGYRAGIGDEMAGFDLLLSLSDAEGLPINLIEAGWAGTPVAATSVGGVRDLLGVPPAGLALDPIASSAAIARSLYELLADPPRRAALGEALQRRVETSFSRRAWLHRLEEVYATLR